ncbi:MAG: hypothetical protein PHH71_01415 [Clostridia bacterium]|nr:hypothetical protein [Clostridia bacterium]MDD3231772.1 hypothetical protein [Clostridia bacterium]MDD4408575.1 hypothetical protein [Clostridia bacterium]
MKKSISKNVICILLLLIALFAFNIYLPNSIYAYSNNNVTFEEITLTNSKFNNAPSSTSLEKNPSGWTMLKTSSATSGIINVNEKNNRFSSNYSNYQLESTENPKTISADCDDKVLMINAKNSKGEEYSVLQGYSSNTIELKSYSYYEIRVLAYTMNNAKASIYLNGFDALIEENEQGRNHIINNSFEKIDTNKIWTEYTFFVQTNFEKITANLALYLGATNNTVSTGVAFFDNVSVLKVAESKFFSDVENAENSGIKFNLITPEINYIENYNESIYNFNFENGSTVDSWLIDGEFDAKTTFLQVMNIKTSDVMESYDLNYLGTDNTKDNKFALVLSSKNDTYAGYTSKESISIEQFGLYKISLNVKCDISKGNAYVILTENNDVNLFYGEDYDFYTPTNNSIKISSNSTDKLLNNYRNVSFYVAGHSLYDTSVKIGLWLGAEDDLSSGTVIFDNITVEKLNYNQYNSANSDSNNKIVSFITVTGAEPTVKNAFFNKGKDRNFDTIYPVEADSWTQTVSDAEYSNVNLWGIVNTNIDKWNTNGLSLVNPKNPVISKGGVNVSTPITDTNNILMIYNKQNSYQTITSPEISISKNSYYNLSFDYKANTTNPIFSFYIVDENNKILYEDLNIVSSFNDWKNYVITIKTEHNNISKLKLIFEVGKENSKVKGVAYFDNVILDTKTYTDDEFADLVSENSNKILDLSSIGFNVKGDKPNDFNIYEALLFESNLENGTQTDGEPIAIGGIIDENNNYGVNFPETNTNTVKNMLAISTRGESTYSLTSKLEFELSAETYYKFSIFIKTQFDGESPEDEDILYGAEFTLNGLAGASIINIKSEEFKEYTIYVFADEASTVFARFALTSADYETTGNAFFDNFGFETIDKEKYDAATASEMALKFTTSEAESEPEEPEPEEEESETEAVGADFWIALGTIIMTVAIILAVVLFYIRKIDFKKLQVKKVAPTTYDRATTVARDSIVREAQKRRDAEIKLYNEEIKDLEDYLVKIEEDNKERISKQRAKFGKTITRQAEKDFKLYAGTRGRTLKDIEKIKEKIKEVNSPEWLIQQEKYIVAEQAKIKNTSPVDENKEQGAEDKEKTVEESNSKNSKSADKKADKENEKDN